MLECSPGELLTKAVFMHHGDQWHDALRHHAVLKGLKHYATLNGLRFGLGYILHSWNRHCATGIVVQVCGSYSIIDTLSFHACLLMKEII